MRFLASRFLTGLSIGIAGCTLSLEGSAAAAGASLDGATSEQSTSASDKYRAGTESFEAQKFPEALALFRESYGIVASPNSHLMIARTLVKMGKNADAYEELEATIREAEAAGQKSDKYRKTAQTARTERDELKPKVGTVQVGIQASVSVGGREVPHDAFGQTLVVDPGKTTVVIKLASGGEEQRDVDVAAGQTVNVDVAPPAPNALATPTPAAQAPCPAAEAAHPNGIDQRALAIVAGGVGVLGFATFAVFGVLDQKKFSDLQDKCPAGVCSSSVASGIDTGRTYQTLANVGLGVGLVGAAAGIVLFATAPSRHGVEQASSVAPTGDRHGSGLHDRQRAVLMRWVCVAMALATLHGCANDYERFRITRATATTATPPTPGGTNEADSGPSDAAPDGK